MIIVKEQDTTDKIVNISLKSLKLTQEDTINNIVYIQDNPILFNSKLLFTDLFINYQQLNTVLVKS
jgi:hypothetical protein